MGANKNPSKGNRANLPQRNSPSKPLRDPGRNDHTQKTQRTLLYSNATTIEKIANYYAVVFLLRPPTALFLKNFHRAVPALQELGLVLRAGVWHSTSVVQPLPWVKGGCVSCEKTLPY